MRNPAPRLSRLLSSACMALLLTRAAANSETGRIDLDGRVDAANILRTAQDDAKTNEFFNDPIEARPVLMPHFEFRLKSALSVPGPQEGRGETPHVMSGGFIDAIANHSGYRAAAQYIPLIQQKPPEVSAPLLKEWDSIQTTRGVLLDEAGGLESQRDQIVAEGEALDRRGDELMKEQAALNQDIDDWNRDCAGRPPTNSCVNRRTRLEQRKAALTAKFEDHRRTYDAWEKKVAAFNDKAAGHNGRRNSWGETIKAFVRTARERIEAEEICQFKRVDRQKLKCQYQCQVYLNGVPVRNLGWWEMDWDGREGSCPNFEDRDKLTEIPSGPAILGLPALTH